MAPLMRFFLLFHIHLLRAVKPCFEGHPKVFHIQIRTARVADSDSRTTGRGFLFPISHIIISIINYKKKLAKVRGDFLSIKLLELLVICLVSCTHFTCGAYTKCTPCLRLHLLNTLVNNFRLFRAAVQILRVPGTILVQIITKYSLVKY